MTFDELLANAAARGASDVHLRAGEVPFVRIAGQLEQWTSVPPTSAEHLEATASRMLSAEQLQRFRTAMHLDVAWKVSGVGRVRANVFKQQGTVGISMRLIPEVVPAIEQLGLPPTILDFASEMRGLVLVTGVTGSGKSTTLASLIDFINRTKPVHIVTLEDPIEFVHHNMLAVVTQREIGLDVPNYASGVRAALRQDPDVILIGEMRNTATIRAALMAASTGHLVFSTLHTTDAAETVGRIVSPFASSHQATIRQQLADVLRATISQRLVPRADGKGLALAAEVLVATPYIRDCIAKREKAALINDAIASGGSQYGMQSFDQSILKLVNEGIVDADEALRWVTNVEQLKMQLRGITRGSAVVETPVAAPAVTGVESFSSRRAASR